MSLFVVKIGGALLNTQGAPDAFWQAVLRLREQADVVLLHGGGPQATEVARKLGHVPRIVHGRRVTTDLDLEIIEWTLRGSVNVRLVGQARKYGIRAAGLSGADDAMVQVHRRPPREVDGETVDFGWVGDVDRVDVALLHLLIEQGRLPIIAPMGVDTDGRLFNVNADTVAAWIAGALGADRLYLVAESGGVRKKMDDPASLLSVCRRSDYEAGLREGWIAGGMRVKLEVAFLALARGVGEVVVVAPEDLLSGAGGTLILEEGHPAS